MQNGDMKNTHGSISKIKKDYNFNPKTTINNGIEKFVIWYKKFYEI